jgi:hypothetical protein
MYREMDMRFWLEKAEARRSGIDCANSTFTAHPSIFAAALVGGEAQALARIERSGSG